MSELDNDQTELPVVDELTALKERADKLGVTYHPSIGLEKLREKVNAAITSEVKSDEDESDQAKPNESDEEVLAVKEETLAERRHRKRMEANELIRVNITCMNPAKKEWEGEIITAGNSLVGSFKKYIPFNTVDGWHVPRVILNQLKERQCQVFYTYKDPVTGQTTRKGKLIKEFGIEYLDNLTPKEIHDLAQRQAMAGTVEQ